MGFLKGLFGKPSKNNLETKCEEIPVINAQYVDVGVNADLGGSVTQSDTKASTAPAKAGPIESPFKNEPKAETLPPGERWRVWKPKDDGYNTDVMNTIRDGLKSAIILSRRVLDKVIVTEGDVEIINQLVERTDWEKYQHRNYFLNLNNMNEVRETRYFIKRITRSTALPSDDPEFPRLNSNQETKETLEQIKQYLQPFQKTPV